MTGQIIAGVLLGVAVVVVLLSAVGILVMKDVYQRLHFVTPMAIVAPLLVGLAVTAREGWDVNTGATWLALGLVVLASPYVSHATMRAARIREQGDWRSSDGHRSGNGRSRQR